MASLKNVLTATALVGALAASGCEGQLIGGVATEHHGGGDGGSLDAGIPTVIQPVVMRRLNRAEYNNTVRDLLGTELRPADQFPTDDLGAGFPTVGSSLSLSPAYVLRYEAAAHALVEDLFASEERRARVVTCDVEAEGDACARTILGDFARRAWRRPLTEDEVTSLLHPLAVAKEHGAPLTDGLRHALAAVLLSPHFIFKVEVSEGRLSPFELATRLSYALWATMPDDELLAAAEAGDLDSDEGLSAQVDRMLADPRADALLENFAARWLHYEDLELHDADADLFPTFSPDLARSMKQEANLFIREHLQSDLPIPELLLSTFTYVDERLNEHYGLGSSPPNGLAPGEMWRVDTSSSQERGGLLTLGALLTSTSFPSRTSPVKRGDFVFSHLLCGKIPPPPPEVEGLPETGEGETTTLRERMERHSKDPACSGCHSIMDPLGFGLEHYDAIGRYRTHEGQHPVNASGVLPGDIEFQGVFELSSILSEDPRFPLCVTKHFMIYALGRILTGKEDDQWVAYLTDQALQAEGSLKSVIRSVVLSEPFRTRAQEEQPQ